VGKLTRAEPQNFAATVNADSLNVSDRFLKIRLSGERSTEQAIREIEKTKFIILFS
jgi:hypothetical protein